MLATSGRRYMETAPYLAIIPGLFISVTVVSFNMVGDTIETSRPEASRGTLSAVCPKQRKVSG